MDFKKKAGLALALAAIFTTGGANLALAADNITSTTDPTDVVAGDEPTVIDFTVDGSGKTATVENLTVTGNVIFAEGMKDAIVPIKVMTVADSRAIPFKEIQLDNSDAHLALGKADSAPITASLNKVTLSNAAAVIDAVGGGSFSMTEIAGSTANATINIQGDSSKNQSTALTVGKLNATAAIKINVGDTDGAGQLTVTGTGANAATLAGSLIFADPAWVNGTAVGSTVELNGASTVAIAAFVDNKIDGKLAAGQKSFFTVGDDSAEWMKDVINETGRWGATDITAAFGLYSTHILNDAGSILVDGRYDGVTANFTGTDAAAAAAVKTATFDNQSLYVANLSGGATLTTGSTDTAVQIGRKGVTTADGKGAAFYGYNPKNGGEYTIIKGLSGSKLTFGNGTAINAADTDLTAADMGNHWSGKNLLLGSDLFNGAWSVVDGGGSTFNLVLKTTYAGADRVREKFPLLSGGLISLVDDIYKSDAKDLDSDNLGIAFVTNALETVADPAESARILESAARVAVAAAVPGISSNVAGKFSSLVVDHNNMLNATQPAYGNEPGQLGLWVNPFYHTSDVDGMDAGKFENGYEMNYGGAAFGIDYNVTEAFRLGLAINVGGGDSESEGDLLKTENDFDFFGASLYGSYSNGAFGLTGDLGFTGIDSEISQRHGWAAETLKGDADSDALTVGLTGQYRFAASDNFNITPYLGLRYTKISVDNVKLKASGDEVMEIATDDQNLFQIPLGVKFSSDIATDGGWTISPSADLGVLFTTGDTDVDSRMRVPGRRFSDPISSEAVDGAAFQGALGVKAAADNGLSLGLDYGILASGNQTDHQFSGMLRFEF